MKRVRTGATFALLAVIICGGCGVNDRPGNDIEYELSDVTCDNCLAEPRIGDGDDGFVDIAFFRSYLTPPQPAIRNVHFDEVQLVPFVFGSKGEMTFLVFGVLNRGETSFSIDFGGVRLHMEDGDAAVEWPPMLVQIMINSGLEFLIDVTEEVRRSGYPVPRDARLTSEWHYVPLSYDVRGSMEQVEFPPNVPTVVAIAFPMAKLRSGSVTMPFVFARGGRQENLRLAFSTFWRRGQRWPSEVPLKREGG